MNIRAATTARRFLQLAVILILTACALPAQSQPPACLIPTSAAQLVDIALNAAGYPEFPAGSFALCPGQNAAGKDKGYICLDIHKKTNLKFRLPQSSPDNWEFVEIQLSGDNQNWPGELPPGAYADFQFGSDAALLLGKPFVTLTANNRHMEVSNNNCHAFMVYYRILLKNTANNEYVYLHPIMDNRGSNN